MAGPGDGTPERIAVIAELLRQAGRPLACAQVAHLLQLLAEIEGCPPGYRFHVGPGGPDDARVAADLELGEAYGYLRSALVRTAYGEERTWGAAARLRCPVDSATRDAIVRILRVFGTYDRVRLADAATIVHADRWHLAREITVEARQLTDIVASIRFADPARIAAEVSRLNAMGYLRAVR